MFLLKKKFFIINFQLLIGVIVFLICEYYNFNLFNFYLYFILHIGFLLNLLFILFLILESKLVIGFSMDKEDLFYFCLYYLTNDILAISFVDYDDKIFFYYSDLFTFFFFTVFIYAFQFLIVIFLIYCSNLEKGFFIKYLKINSKIFIIRCLEIYTNSRSFISYLNLLDWCYQNYPIKTFLFVFYCLSCVTFKYMHYFDVGFHFYEFFESLLYFFLNFFICLILLFFLFVFLLNFYGLYLQFFKLNKIYQYVLFFSLFYIFCSCPFYFFFDLFSIHLIDNLFF